MNVLLDFRPFLNEIPSNGDFFCEDFFHALFRNSPNDVFYIWTTGSEHLLPQYKFDQYHNVRRIHTEIEIDKLYRLIRYMNYPSIDDLVETLAMKNGHMAWVGKFDVAFFATPMPVLLEGDCVHVQITNHLKPLHTPNIFLESHMQYQEKKWYVKNWKNADINIVPSEFLVSELRNYINEDDDDTSIFVSNVGLTQNINRYTPDENLYEKNIQDNKDEIHDILEMDSLYKESAKTKKIYDELPDKFFYSKETTDTIENTLKAFSLFCGRFPDANLHLIVEEPFLDAFKFTHYLKRGDNISIIPPATEEKKIILYSKCTAFISPDIYNTEGKCILEAMKCGAIILSSSYGAFPEICPDSNFFFDPHSYTELFKAMKYAHTLETTDKKILSDHNIAISSSSQYSWDDITEKIMANLSEILEEKELSM